MSVLNMGRGRLFGLMALASLVVLLAGALIATQGVADSAGHGDYVFGTCAPGAAGYEIENPDDECVDEEVNVKGLNAIQISAGRNHVYALKADGTLEGWGIERGGDADFGQIDTPQLMVWRGNDVRASKAPDSAEIGADDRPQMSEAGQEPAVGNRSMVDQEPVRWSQVAAGDNHTCAVTTEGEVHCWGRNNEGQTDIPMRLLVRQDDPELPLPWFTKIVAGGNHTCVIEAETTVSVTPMRAGGATEMPAGSLVCWGDPDSFAQIASNPESSPPMGDPHPAHRQPLPADGSAGAGGVAGTPPNGDIGHADDDGAPEAPYQYIDVSAGFDHTCAIRTTGIVDCWGSNAYGKGNAPRHLQMLIDQYGRPMMANPQGLFHSIEAGKDHTCAINAEGGALCWGSNAHEQEYPYAGEYIQLSSGYWHGCAIWTYDDDPQRETQPEAPAHESILSPPGNMDCWGDDRGSNKTRPPVSVTRYGTAADGTRVSKTFRPGWYQVSAGASFTCGILDADPSSTESPPPATADQALRFSATAAVSEGIVDCWGVGGAVNAIPTTDNVGIRLILDDDCGPVGPTVVGDTHATVTAMAGQGRIYGKTSADGSIEFAFKVIVSDAPDDVILPGFRFVPSSGSLTVGRWYFSDMMYTDGVRANGIECEVGENAVAVGRIAVRLLSTGHMELALMTTDGMIMANIPANHNRIPNPSETGNRWWRTDRIGWS